MLTVADAVRGTVLFSMPEAPGDLPSGMACGRRVLRIIILSRTLLGTTAKLVSEGQQTPLTVYDSGHTDEKGRKVYILIGGFRRSHATIAIEMWPAR